MLTSVLHAGCTIAVAADVTTKYKREKGTEKGYSMDAKFRVCTKIVRASCPFHVKH